MHFLLLEPGHFCDSGIYHPRDSIVSLSSWVFFYLHLRKASAIELSQKKSEVTTYGKKQKRNHK